MEAKKMNRRWLSDVRINHGKTRAEVAHLSGISPQMYSYIELGQRQPSVGAAKRIAAVLGFDWIKFFDEHEAEDSA